MPATPPSAPDPFDPPSPPPTSTLLVPVPAKVSATYVVAAPEHTLPDPAGEIASALADVPFPEGREPFTITVTEATQDDPTLAWACEILCCPDCSPGAEHLLGTLLSKPRQRHLVVTATTAPGWPPSHLYAAAKAVHALAEATGGIPLDAEAPRLLPSRWRPTPPAGPEAFASAEWIWIGVSPDRGGSALLTTGLTRLGLPELRAEAVPPTHVAAWTRLFKALAQVLTRRLFTGLAATPPGPATLVVPTELVVMAADAAAAEGILPPRDPRAVTVRLGYGPPSPRVPVTHLTVTAHEREPVTWAAEEGPPLPDG
ncbi:hypothetical protein AB0K60_10540 [Thermopolyspora sp. NPDC052614]|uniref:hypothetical protein n=1 Tax=Thermopolyspora sp. NPDC052614 TaxID=3155682 RepID=UPI003425D474